MEIATPDATMPQAGMRRALSEVDALRGRGDDATLNALVKALDSEYQSVRRRAAELLAEQREPAVKLIQQQFAALTEAQRGFALIVVARVLGEGALPWLRGSYQSSAGPMRSSVIQAVSEIPGTKAIEFLIEALGDESWLNRYAAAEALERRGEAALDKLKAGFAEGTGEKKYWCLQLLVRIFGKGAANFLSVIRNHEDPDIRLSAIRALGDIDEDWAVGQLIEFLADRHWTNRQVASRQLVARGKRCIDALSLGLKHANHDVVYWSLMTLGRIGDEAMVKPAVAVALSAEGERAPDVREWVADALLQLKSESAARRVVELALEFADLRSRVAVKLAGAGAIAVPALLREAVSSKAEVKAFARSVLPTLGFPRLGAIIEELDRRTKSEHETFIKAVRSMTMARLADQLSRADASVDSLINASRDTAMESMSSMPRITVNVPVLKLPVESADEDRPRYVLSIDELLKRAIEAGASDVHIKAGIPPIFRIQGRLGQVELPVLTPADTQELIRGAVSAMHLTQLLTKKELDASYEIPGVSRFRLNCFSEMNGMAMVARVIPNRVPTLNELDLPRVFRNFCNFIHGMILICGPTGSGKSTTLAAMIDYINETREEHILTIEDPIEFRHQNKKCLITSRELGINTLSFANALRSALREDPDIILVGELRDFETIELAMTAAETGHLVLSTLHTGTTAEAVDRLINSFPPEQQQNARVLLASVLKAVVCQMLLPTPDGRRIAAHEVLINNYAVSNLIREKKMAQVDQVIVTGRKDGMQARDDHLFELARAGRITAATALEYALNRQELDQKLGRRGV